MKKISLTCIAGNCESQIDRFLDCFQPWFDEVVIVRAVGNQESDKTLEIAENRGCKIGYYNNIKDWPHVDDFAAARNMALDMSTHNWLMWADIDDVMTEDSGKQIRRLVEDIDDKDVHGVLMRYVVPEDGVVNWRERLWRKGTARWENPIHECLKFNDGAKHMRFDGAEIVHASDIRSAARDERNLRILESIPEDQRTISQKFHVFQSLIAIERNAEAVTKAIEFVQLPDVGINERYEAFFQLARLAEDEETKHAMLLQALATDPTRREAYGELGLASVMRNPTAALGWTDAMNGLRMPQDPPWNLRRSYYGSLGIGLRTAALRVNDRVEEADVIEWNHFIQNGAKISLLHATRGRPGLAWKQRAEWLRNAHNPDAIEHIFSIDADDELSMPLIVARCVVNNGSSGPVAAWNAAAKASRGKVLIQLSDDFHSFPGWDTAILDAIGDTSKPAVLAVSDGQRADDLLCMAILTRQRWKDQGDMFHPEFFSMFSDNWFSYCAFKDGVIIDARNKIVFEHRHPAFGKAEMDETYARSNDPTNYENGKHTFERLKAGILTPTGIDGWCDYRAFYQAVAKTLPDGGSFAEVGSWMGQSAVVLCQHLQDIGKKITVHCIDTFQGEENEPAHTATVAGMGGNIRWKFEENIAAAGVSDMIQIVESDSAAAASFFDDESLDGIFIDAAHDHDSVVKDLAAWWPKLKPGGIWSGHDYPHDGVKIPVDEHAEANGYEVASFGRCWIKTKSQP